MENNETNVPRIIAMANMKGGVGKTTSTIGTAIALTRLGRKVEVRARAIRRNMAVIWRGGGPEETAFAARTFPAPVANPTSSFVLWPGEHGWPGHWNPAKRRRRWGP